MNYQETKQQLLPYLHRYLKKPHIESRSLFQSYIDRLDQNKYLTERMVSHIISFLKYDTKLSDDVLKDHLNVLIVGDYEEQTPPATLEAFLQ